MAINNEIRICIEFGILKKRYCALCGEKLKRKIIQTDQIYTYKPFCLPFLKERQAKRIIVIPVYYCKKCDYMIDYDSQKQIYIKQKENNTYILSDGKSLVKKLKVK